MFLEYKNYLLMSYITYKMMTIYGNYWKLQPKTWVGSQKGLLKHEAGFFSVLKNNVITNVIKTNNNY